MRKTGPFEDAGWLDTHHTEYIPGRSSHLDLTLWASVYVYVSLLFLSKTHSSFFWDPSIN